MTQSKQKLDELFLLAFQFVNDDFNWCRIKALAGFILDEPKDVISYEDVIYLLGWGVRDRPERTGLTAKPA